MTLSHAGQSLRARPPLPPCRHGGLARGATPLEQGEHLSIPVSAPDDSSARSGSQAEVYRQVQSTPEFQKLRRRYRDFAFPCAVAFLAWYLLYVLLSVSARGFMSRPVLGEINVALVLGLGQFASTFLLTWLYARYAETRRDRLAMELRRRTQEALR